jgi:glyoxylase-like metal-dependent hydrolase (beta-lactamase superfamily II)
VFMPGPNRSPYPNCNGLYVDAGVKVLIDQGGSVEQARELEQERGIDRIYVTHWHEDHAVSACQLPDIPVYAPEQDREPIESRALAFERTGVAEEKALRDFGAMFDRIGFCHRPVSETFAPEQTIDLGGVTMLAMHTPGHTLGHTCFWFPDEELVVLGDYDLTRAGPVTSDIDSDVRQTYASLERLSKLPVKIAASAHGRGWFEADEYRERIASYIQVLDDRLDAIVDLVRRGNVTTPDLVRHAPALWSMTSLPGYATWVAMAGDVMLRPCTRYLVEEGHLRELEPDQFEAIG